MVSARCIGNRTMVWHTHTVPFLRTWCVIQGATTVREYHTVAIGPGTRLCYAQRCRGIYRCGLGLPAYADWIPSGSYVNQHVAGQCLLETNRGANIPGERELENERLLRNIFPLIFLVP